MIEALIRPPLARPRPPRPLNRLLHAFTVDVEDYFHVSGFADRISRTEWDHYPSRVVASTGRVLNLLERHQVQATFFVLGWVAQRFPDLVHDIAAAGHEIGCHSQWHRLVYDLTPEEFRMDLIESRDGLQQIVGRPVTVYRAPSFSITHRSLWALEILREEGFTLDASIFPVHHDRYGIPEAEPGPHVLTTAAGRLREFPGTTARWMGKTLPVGGGGYLRLYPLELTKVLLHQVQEKSQRPFMVYVHPWEFDPDQPRLPGSWKSRFRHYVGIHTTEAKLDRLLATFPFGTMSESFDRFSAIQSL